jgi:putative heme iron utilization protein
MRRFALGDAFVDAMADVAKWGDVTLIVHTDDGIMEFTGPIPSGQVGCGYYNQMGSTGFHGHIRHERCAGLAFVERPFMGKSSAFVAFFNTSAFSKSGLPVLRSNARPNLLGERAFRAADRYPLSLKARAAGSCSRCSSVATKPAR